MKEFKDLIDCGFECYSKSPTDVENLRVAQVYFENQVKDNCAMKDAISMYNLTYREVFALALIETTFYKEIQTPLSKNTEPNLFIKDIISNLLSLLNKLPYTNNSTVYRSDRFQSCKSLSVGGIIKCDFFLTASREKLNPPNNEGIMSKFEITTLPNGRCRDVYRVLNYGYCSGYEWQVNFLVGTCFVIDEIVISDGIPLIKCTECEYQDVFNYKFSSNSDIVQ